jgi:hypothetical protein
VDSNYLVYITDPSRTADIELTVTLGVQGPKNLCVWMMASSGETSFIVSTVVCQGRVVNSSVQQYKPPVEINQQAVRFQNGYLAFQGHELVIRVSSVPIGNEFGASPAGCS